MESLYHYRSDVQEIPQIRKDLSKLGSSWKIPDSEKRQIGVIIEELFSNIIRFAYSDSDEHIIAVRISMRDREITIQIVDDGAPFNPVEFNPTPDPEPASYDSGGMGLVLVKTFSDSLVYSRKDRKNFLEITKILRSK